MLGNQSEALPMHDGTPNPHRVLALWWCDDLDLHRGGSECRQLLRHAFADAREHGITSGQHNIRVQIFADVQITLHDGLEGGVMDAACLLANERWLEEHFRASESL